MVLLKFPNLSKLLVLHVSLICYHDVMESPHCIYSSTWISVCTILDFDWFCNGSFANSCVGHSSFVLLAALQCTCILYHFFPLPMYANGIHSWASIFIICKAWAHRSALLNWLEAVPCESHAVCAGSSLKPSEKLLLWSSHWLWFSSQYTSVGRSSLLSANIMRDNCVLCFTIHVYLSLRRFDIHALELSLLHFSHYCLFMHLSRLLELFKNPVNSLSNPDFLQRWRNHHHTCLLVYLCLCLHWVSGFLHVTSLYGVIRTLLNIDVWPF